MNTDNIYPINNDIHNINEKSPNYINFVNYIKNFFNRECKKHSKDCMCTIIYDLNIIEKIHNIPIKINIEYNKSDNNSFILNIYHKNIYKNKYGIKKILLYKNYIFKNIKNITLKIISNLIAKIIDILKKLIFSKFSGKFYLDTEKDSDKQFIEYSIFTEINIKSLKLSCEDCCVCYDATSVKTSCEHFLCIECWSNLRHMNCPLCKEYIKFLPNNGTDGNTDDDTDDDSDESD